MATPCTLPAVRSRIAVAIALGASAAAAVAWTRDAPPAPPAPSIKIVDVRPLWTPDAGLRDFVTHVAKVRVAITGWGLLPYHPGASARDNRPHAGHWRLYLDGYSLGDTQGRSTVSYTTYLPPGTHWLAAELSNADGTSPRPPVWSEPVTVDVPRVVRCWQTGWRGPIRRLTCRIGTEKHEVKARG